MYKYIVQKYTVTEKNVPMQNSYIATELDTVYIATELDTVYIATELDAYSIKISLVIMHLRICHLCTRDSVIETLIFL